MNASSLLGNLYPAGPAAVPPNLTAASAAYKQRAWLAMAGLALFVLLYFALSGWFAWTAYRLLRGLGSGNFSLWGALAGACAAFLAVFMLKALFFVKHGYDIDDIEITRAQQPRLFEFVDRIADEAQAPRAHKIYLSPRVNAAVFYDLSLLNLLIPSKKNLEIGLGLVNVVTLGELKAVLAHEFGHFAQRSMAVGRWVYIAQQIAGHIIAKRDILDKFLAQLSRLDLRIAWVGWLLSLVVWSIRSLMEIVFRGVVIAQRALSRQMEFQADLVAVSLTGSDALIHALHRLGAADEAWDRTLSFADAEAHAQRGVKDLFAVQTRIINRVRDILNQPHYGGVPPLPAAERANHRVFKAQLAQPPRMWSTHPPNEEREQNAKQRYVEAPIDARSAWDLFDNAQGLREQLSAHVLRNAKDLQPNDMTVSLQTLDKQYDRAYLNRSYRGAYLGRSIVRGAQTPAELYAQPIAANDIRRTLDSLYAESLGAQIEQLSELQEEKAALEALRDQVATAPGGIMRHRGSELQRTDLPGAIAGIEHEHAELLASVEGHDKRCRRAHLAAAESFGRGWPEYLRGLLQLLHYADHGDANLRDAQGAFYNAYHIVTADGRVSSGERKRLLDAAHDLYRPLARLYEAAPQVTLDRTVLRRMAAESWPAALGKFELPPPNDQQLGDWLNVIDSWVGGALGALGALRTAALEQLLLSEAQVAKFFREGLQPVEAPPPSSVPAEYDRLLPGKERPRQTKLGWWDKFQTADGALATSAKLLVAGGIVGGVMAAGGKVGESTVNVYNGLDRPVVVELADQRLSVGPGRSNSLAVPEEALLRIVARTREGETIESFEQQLHGSFESYVYNVASAAPLYEWTAVYGGGSNPEPRMLGAKRWSTTNADHVFEEPPERADSGSRRRVLAGGAEFSPSDQLAMLADDEARTSLAMARARWESPQSPHVLSWMWVASQSPQFGELLAVRLKEAPSEPVFLRMEQDTAGEAAKAGVCARHAAAATREPRSPDWQYAAIRCLPDGPEQGEQFLAAQKRFPQHGWLALAAGYTHLERGEYGEALELFELARKGAPAAAEPVVDESARIRRLVSTDGAPDLTDLLRASQSLAALYAPESGDIPPDSPLAGYRLLARGDLAGAAQHARKQRQDGEGLLLLAAASDGASAELRVRALDSRPSAGIGLYPALAGYGLAVREGRRVEAYAAIVRAQLEGSADELWKFLEAVRTTGAEAPLPTSSSLRERGLALSTAALMLGAQAPPQWRDQAKRLLFVGERPYFK